MRGSRLVAMGAGAVVLAVAVLVGGTAAEADTVILPPPVQEVPAVPSAVAKSLTGSPLGDSGYGDAVRFLLWAAKNGQNLTGAGVAADASPELLAGASLSEATGAGALALAGGIMIGIAGDATMQITALATGQTEQQVACQNPDWYTGTIHVLTMMTSPTCTSTVLTPNADQSTTYSLSYPGLGTYAYEGSVYYPGTSSTQGCVQTTGAVSGGTGSSTWQLGVTYGPGYSYPVVVQGTGNVWCQHVGATGNAMYDVSGQHAGRPVFEVWGYSGPSQVLATETSTTPNPQRTPVCTIKWTNGTTTSAAGIPYLDTTGIPTSAAGLGCEAAYTSQPGRGPGLLPSEIDIDSQTGGGAKTRIATAPVPSFSPDEAQQFVRGNGHGLVLQKVVGGVTTSCMGWQVSCAGWWSATSQGTSPTTSDGSSYQCTYGGASIALTECATYQQTFDTQTSTPTITDPTTGAQTSWSPDLGPGNTVNPDTPGNPGATGSNCMDSWGTTVNPIDWVLTPIKCALEWAFVPDPVQVQGDITGMETDWSDTAPAKIPGIVATALTVPNLGSGCQGPHISFTVPWNWLGYSTSWSYDGYPLSACTDPAATLATFCRVIGAAILIYFTGLGVIRRISAIVNTPGLG